MATKNPWNDYVEVFIPKRSRTEADTQLVSINMRNFFVPKGKPVKVPRPVAEVLRYRENAMQEAYEEAKSDYGGYAAPVNGIVPENKFR